MVGTAIGLMEEGEYRISKEVGKNFILEFFLSRVQSRLIFFSLCFSSSCFFKLYYIYGI